MARMPTFDPINYLVEKRFPSLLNASSSPFADEDAQKRFDKRQKQVEEFVRELRQKSDDEIDALVSVERKKEAEQEAKRIADREAALFFNRRDSDADFEHWSRAAYWTLEEGVALSFGKEPALVNWEKLLPYRQVSPFAKRYRKRRDLVRRAAAIKQIYDTNFPEFFLGWAKRNGMDLPPSLLDLVEKNGQQIADWPVLLEMANKRTEEAIESGKRTCEEAIESGKRSFREALDSGRKMHAEALAAWKANADELREAIRTLTTENEQLKLQQASVEPEPEKPINAKSRLSLLKLVLGMAIDGYRFDPKSSKSSLPGELVDDLALIGISIDESTVRSWLREAASSVDFKFPE